MNFIMGDGIGGIFTRLCTCAAISPNTESEMKDGNSVITSSVVCMRDDRSSVRRVVTTPDTTKDAYFGVRSIGCLLRCRGAAVIGNDKESGMTFVQLFHSSTMVHDHEVNVTDRISPLGSDKMMVRLPQQRPGRCQQRRECDKI